MSKNKEDAPQSELGIKDQLRQRLKDLKTRKMLPKGYGKLVAKRVVAKAKAEGKEVKCSENNVNQVVAGNSLRMDIVEAVIELAENSKEKLLLDRLNKVLEE